MKKIKLTGLILLFIPLASILLYCCSKKDITQTSSAEKTAQIATMQKASAANTAAAGSSDTCGSCSKSYSGTHSGAGFWTYYQPLDLSCSDTGGQVTVSCIYYDVPNTFSVQDKNGQTVLNTTGGYCTTGWIGNANCSGPWSSGGQGGINTLQYQTDIKFIFHQNLAPYRLKVETSITHCSNCGSNNTGCTSNDDTWTAGVNCAKRNDHCSGCTPPPDSCGSCGGSFSGTHAGVGGVYSYPLYPLNMACAKDNKTVVKVGCIYYDVPNTFDVIDKNNVSVASTNWIGNANCPGRWGNSINTLQYETYISFTYQASRAPYYLKVTTNIIGCTNCGSNNPGCTDTDDNWYAGVTCTTPQ